MTGLELCPVAHSLGVAGGVCGVAVAGRIPGLELDAMSGWAAEDVAVAV